MPSLFRSLGAFVGHVWRGVTADPANPPPDLRDNRVPRKTVLRRDVAEEQRDTPHGRVTLRRTTIEEIEVDRSKQEG